MSKPKIRRVNFYPDEYVTGVGGRLSAVDQGIYWMVCTLIYSHGGPIDDDHVWLSRLFADTHWRTVRASLDRLTKMGKLERTEGAEGPQINVRRCAEELQKARTRVSEAVQNGRKGGRPSKENNDLTKPEAFPDEKLTINHQPITNNHQPISKADTEPSGDAGDGACSPADLIGSIRGVVVELWAVPSWTPSSRPDKNSSRSSAEIAAAWVKAGITPERLRELVRPALERLRERNERAPSHLAYFANLVREALDADKQRATAEKVYMTQDEWPLRLKAWRRNRIWPSPWGPDPSHPLCLAPKHMLTDEDRKPRAEVVPMRRATA